MATADRPPHSGLGIASAAISLVVGAGIFLDILVAGFISASSPGGMADDSPEAIIIGLMLFLFLAGAIIALALGIAGLSQKDRQKVFPVIGTVLSALIVLGGGAIVLLGFLVQSR